MTRGTPSDEERLQRMEEAILRLREIADGGTVVVEGARDAAALDWLGVGGRHLVVNRGQAMQVVVDELARHGGPVVLLVDWDRTGGRMATTLAVGLRGRVALDEDIRRRFAVAFHCRGLEEVPAELRALRRAVHGER